MTLCDLQLMIIQSQAKKYLISGRFCYVSYAKIHKFVSLGIHLLGFSWLSY